MRYQTVSRVSSSGFIEFRLGWMALLCAFMGVMAGVISTYLYTIGVFFIPLEKQFGWTRLDLSLANFLAAATVAGISPLVGRLADRFGVRTIIVVSLSGLGLGFLGLSFSGGNLKIYLLSTVLVCAVGTGSSPVVFARIVVGWFERKRGLALSIMMCGVSAAAATTFIFLTPFVAEHGWRAGYVALGLSVLALLPPIAFLAKERSNGATEEQWRERTADLAPSAPGMSFREIARSRTFRLLIVSAFAMGLSFTGISQHFVAMLTEAGLSPQQVGLTAGSVGVSSIFARVCVGLLIDRIFAPPILAAAMGLLGLGFMGLAYGGTTFALPTAILIGIAIGAEVDIIAYLVSRYFGLGAYTQTYGCAYGVFVAAAALSPLLVGVQYSISGNYHTALICGVGLLFLSAFLLMRLPPYPRLPASEVYPAAAG
jgi:MFS family permease